MSEEARYREGDRVEYIGRPVFDGIVWTGDAGTVVGVQGDWVVVQWNDGVHSVPIKNVRVGPPVAAHRIVTDVANKDVWALFPEDLLFDQAGRERDAYWQSSCHPDVVVRIWDLLGAAMPEDCRARANGVPVLAHPRTHRIFAAAHGTAYALWLTDEDLVTATAQGASTVMRWSNGSISDLRELAGVGWIWGRDLDAEAEWLKRSYAAVASLGW